MQAAGTMQQGQRTGRCANTPQPHWHANNCLSSKPAHNCLSSGAAPSMPCQHWSRQACAARHMRERVHCRCHPAPCACLSLPGPTPPHLAPHTWNLQSSRHSSSTSSTRAQAKRGTRRLRRSTPGRGWALVDWRSTPPGRAQPSSHSPALSPLCTPAQAPGRVCPRCHQTGVSSSSVGRSEATVHCPHPCQRRLPGHGPVMPSSRTQNPEPLNPAWAWPGCARRARQHTHAYCSYWSPYASRSMRSSAGTTVPR